MRNKKGLSKTAVLLLTIGSDAVRQVLSRLSSSEVEAIAIEIANHSQILDSEKEVILKEFYGDFISKERIIEKEQPEVKDRLSSARKVNKKL